MHPNNIYGSINRLKLVMLMILCQLASSGVTMFYKLAVADGMKVYTLVVYRYMFATIFIAPFALVFERNTRPQFTWITACQGVASGLLGATFGSNLYAESLILTSATYASSMANLIPPLTLIMSLIFRLEKICIRRSTGKAKVLGTALGLCGAMVLTLYKGHSINFWSTKVNLLHHRETSENVHTQKDYIKGSLFALLSCVSYSAWMVLQTKISQRYPFYSSTALICFTGAITSAIYGFSRQQHWEEWKLGFDIRLLASAYSGIIGSAMVIAITTWGTSVKGPLYVTAFTPLSLVFVAVLASIFLDENLHLGSLLGSVLIIMGLYAVLWGKSREMEITEQSSSSSNEPAESTLTMTSCNKIQQNNDDDDCMSAETKQSQAFEEIV